MDGFLNFLKPPGMTSSDAVLMLRRMLPRGVKTGHGGTLDPDAAGVLPICVGRATRLFDYIIDKEKTYIGELTLGCATDTQDASGRILKTAPVSASRADIEALLPAFTGDILQCPPAFSAIKQGGVRLYDLARKGVLTQTPPRPVTICSLDYLRPVAYNQHILKIVCKKGVYIRTLMNDIGEALGCYGHMSFLLRSRAGDFAIEDAVTPEELSGAQDVESLLRPMDYPLKRYPMIALDQRYLPAVKNGNPVPNEAVYPEGTVLRVYVGDRFAGMGEADAEGFIRFRAMLLS